ncbi:MAG: DNA polymerase [Solirubrobacterales bacterium]
MSLLRCLSPRTAIFGLPRELGTWQADVAKFGRLVHGKLGPGFGVAKAWGTAADFRALRDLRAPLGLDIETAACDERSWTGLDPTRAKLKTIALSNESFGVSMHWELANEDTRQAVREVLADPGVLKVLHNGPWFDLRVLERYGMACANWEDTRDMRRALSSTSRLSLRYLGSLYTDIPDWKTKQNDDAEEKGWDSSDLTELQEYNAKDSQVTVRAFHRMRSELDERTTELYGTQKRLAEVAAAMHTRGIWVDQGWRRQEAEHLRENVEAMKELLCAAVEDDNFACTDNAMRALIFRRHKKEGIRCFELPDPLNKHAWTNEHKETISVDENSLLTLLVGGGCPEELAPIIDVWWGLQQEKKRLGYVESRLIDEAIGDDGRLRPGWNSAGAETGRWACSSPNVMNIERYLRAGYGPAPGNAWVYADKSQFELRVMAAVAGDSELQRALDTGDVYSFDARNWFGFGPEVDVKRDNPSARKSCKIIHLGRQYGAEGPTIFEQALRQDRKFTYSRVQLLVKQFDRLYPGTVAYWHTELKRVLADGYSETRLSRRRRTYPVKPTLNEACNYPVQGTASDIINYEIVKLHDRLAAEVGPSAGLVLNIHDALIVECPEDLTPKVKHIMADVLNSEWTIDGRTRSFPSDGKEIYSSKNQSWKDID